MLAQGNQRVAVRGPIASLNSLVEASPAKPRQLFAAAFRPKGRRTLSQSTFRPILSLTHSPLRAGRAGKPILNSKSHRDSYQSLVASDNVMGGPCFQTASFCFSLHSAFAGRLANRYVASNGQRLTSMDYLRANTSWYI